MAERAVGRRPGGTLAGSITRRRDRRSIPRGLRAPTRAALTRHHGHPVDLVEISDTAYRDGLIAGGVPAEFAEVLTGFGEASHAGSFETPLGDFEALTDHPPLAMEDFLIRDPLSGR